MSTALLTKIEALLLERIKEHEEISEMPGASKMTKAKYRARGDEAAYLLGRVRKLGVE